MFDCFTMKLVLWPNVPIRVGCAFHPMKIHILLWFLVEGESSRPVLSVDANLALTNILMSKTSYLMYFPHMRVGESLE